VLGLNEARNAMLADAAARGAAWALPLDGNQFLGQHFWDALGMTRRAHIYT